MYIQSLHFRCYGFTGLLICLWLDVWLSWFFVGFKFIYYLTYAEPARKTIKFALFPYRLLSTDKSYPFMDNDNPYSVTKRQ
jgi:hypothetical protein